MLTKDQISKLLNRPLTSAETTNFSLYLKIAMQRLEELLCVDLCCNDGERTYESRYGYRSVYVDPFTDLNSVVIDGDTVSESDYTIKQNDKFSGSWYNIIEFTTKRRGEQITVDANYGFGSPIPADLQLLLAKLYAQGSIEQTSDNQVKSKSIEDFSVTYRDSATYDEFVKVNASTISRYSQCNHGAIRNGAIGCNDLRSIR